MMLPCPTCQGTKGYPTVCPTCLGVGAVQLTGRPPPPDMNQPAVPVLAGGTVIRGKEYPVSRPTKKT